MATPAITLDKAGAPGLISTIRGAGYVIR